MKFKHDLESFITTTIDAQLDMIYQAAGYGYKPDQAVDQVIIDYLSNYGLLGMQNDCAEWGSTGSCIKIKDASDLTVNLISKLNLYAKKEPGALYVPVYVLGSVAMYIGKLAELVKHKNTVYGRKIQIIAKST